MTLVFAKNSIGHKERIIHASVEGARDLLYGRALHIGWWSGVGDTPVLTCAESSRNGIDSRWGETPFPSENKPSRRPPLVPVMESTDFKKFGYGTKLRRLNGA